MSGARRSRRRCVGQAVADVAHAAQDDEDADEAAQRAGEDRGCEALDEEL
jgi:hypothetical protein